MRDRYPKLVTEALGVLRAVATAQQGIAAFAKAYPGEARIANPEHVARTKTAKADKVVSEREVWRWEYLNGVPLPDNYDRAVCQHHRRLVVDIRQPGIIEMIEAGQYHGSLDGPFECKGDAVRLVRKLRREVLRTERLSLPLSLATTLVLPGLLPDDADWKAEHWSADYLAVLAQLDRMSTRVERKPKVVVEYLAIGTAGKKAA